MNEKDCAEGMYNLKGTNKKRETECKCKPMLHGETLFMSALLLLPIVRTLVCRLRNMFVDF